MSKPTSFNLLFAGLGLICALVLGWLWRQSTRPTDVPQVRSEQGIPNTAPQFQSTPGTASVATRPTLSPELQAMLTELVRALVSGNAREREAVLAFKDDASLQRFLQRAQRSGLTVLGQLVGSPGTELEFAL